MVAQVLALLHCWLWEAGSSPDLQCSGGLSPGPFCVEFACSPRLHKGFPPLRTPTEKTCKRTEHVSILRDRDGRFTWSTGAEKLPTAPGGSWRKDGPGWVKCRAYISQRPQACVCLCVCVLCRLHKIHVCVAVCRVCHNKLTENQACLFVVCC